MDIVQILVVIFGLCLFEIISSVDNAIINAHVLKTLPEKFRKFFLTFGLLVAVVLVRGFLPFLIVWLANPAFSFSQVIGFVFHPTAEINAYVEKSQALLLLAGGVYLFFVFLGWLFLEEKKYAFLVEEFVHKQSVWFYAVSSLFITAVVYFSIKVNPILALSAVIGSTAFFIVHGFKQNAEHQERNLMKEGMSDISKILFLEVIDATFSIDGVIGAFAFTLAVPLIILGNGLGAFVVRELSVRNIDNIKKYKFLKNGAMYSILVLGIIMISDAFGYHIPAWLSPLATFGIVGFFFVKSIRANKL